MSIREGWWRFWDTADLDFTTWLGFILATFTFVLLSDLCGAIWRWMTR